LLTASVVSAELAEVIPATAAAPRSTSVPASSSHDDYFDSDSCATSTFCMAVGAYFRNGHRPGQSAILKGGQWVSERVPNIPSFSSNVFANEVSCASQAYCVLVGAHWAGRKSSDRNLAEFWDGSSWQIVIDSGPGATATSGLDDVACPTTRFCMAIGFAGSNRGFQGTAFSSSDGLAWRRLAIPRPRGARNSELAGLACFNSGNCLAVGNYTSLGHNLPYAARWHDGRWELLTTPALPRHRFTYFQGIACPSAGECVAVGNTQDNTARGPIFHAFAEVWSHGTWRISTLRQPQSGFGGASCPAVNRCFASGYTFPPGSNAAYPLIETWNGRTWTTERPVRTPAPNSGDVLNHVSCITRSHCEAVGYSYNPRVQNSDQTLAEVWNGHRWIVQATPNP
jgi:hypothetical protein